MRKFQIESKKTPGNAFRLQSPSHAHRDVVVALFLPSSSPQLVSSSNKMLNVRLLTQILQADNFPQSDMPTLLASPSAAISPRVVVATFGIQARDVEEVWVWHFTLAACTGAEVEVESWTGGGAVVVSTSCVVGVAGS